MQLRIFLTRLLLFWTTTLLLFIVLTIPLLSMSRYLSKQDIFYYYVIASIVAIGLAAIMSLAAKE